jgi:hypothetical protein
LLIAEIHYTMIGTDNPLSETTGTTDPPEALSRALASCSNLHGIDPSWIDIYQADASNQRHGPILLHWPSADE